MERGGMQHTFAILAEALLDLFKICLESKNTHTCEWITEKG